jgi:hypothetical protein
MVCISKGAAGFCVTFVTVHQAGQTERLRGSTKGQEVKSAVNKPKKTVRILYFNNIARLATLKVQLGGKQNYPRWLTTWC